MEGPVSMMPMTFRKEESGRSPTSDSSSELPPSCNGHAMKTLNLGLDEVAHIRSALTKAELESQSIDGSVREDVEKGRVR